MEENGREPGSELYKMANQAKQSFSRENFFGFVNHFPDGRTLVSVFFQAKGREGDSRNGHNEVSLLFDRQKAEKFLELLKSTNPEEALRTIQDRIDPRYKELNPGRNISEFKLIEEKDLSSAENLTTGSENQENPAENLESETERETTEPEQAEEEAEKPEQPETVESGDESREAEADKDNEGREGKEAKKTKKRGRLKK